MEKFKLKPTYKDKTIFTLKIDQGAKNWVLEMAHKHHCSISDTVEQIVTFAREHYSPEEMATAKGRSRK